MPVGQIAKTVYLSNTEYHTSADNLDFERAAHLRDEIDKMKREAEEKLNEIISAKRFSISAHSLK